MKVGLWRIAHARSGDKADRADIGLFAYDAPTYEVLKREVTRERLATHFADICKGPVEIWPLDNLLAMKIVLNAALQGGAARSLRTDNLGKSVAAQLLRLEIEAPATLPRLSSSSARPRDPPTHKASAGWIQSAEASAKAESGDPEPRAGFPLSRE